MPPSRGVQAYQQANLALILRAAVLIYCLLLCDVFAKLFEPKAKKVARLTAELASLEADRLSKLVVVFGYEFDKLGFYTSVSISTVLILALIIQLGRSRSKWKRLALLGMEATGQPDATPSTALPKYAIALALGVATFFYYLTFNMGKVITLSSSVEGGLEPQTRLLNLVVVFGKYELDKTMFYALVCTSMLLLVTLGVQIGIWTRRGRESHPRKKIDDVVNPTGPPRDKILDVIIVGCGPKSVGWFHLMQFLDIPKTNVRAVVEPFYLDESKCPYPPQAFVDLVMMLDDMGIQCVCHVGQLDIFQQPTLCIIAGKTCDNPRFFRECIGMGASHIYLESPGAPTIDRLKDMQSLAATREVEVYMGYQRLCSSYIEQALSLSCSIPKSHVFFCHNEIYRSKELHLVFSRYPEGMIHTMALQELAVLVTQFGVKVDEIKAFKLNTSQSFSEKQIFHYKGNGNKLTDFSRVAFKITTNQGRSLSVMADRCGGLESFAVVKSHTGKELKRFQSHDKDQASIVLSELKQDKEIMHQFIIESEEYLELKKRLVESIFSGDSGKCSGLVSIKDGIDIIALADYCATEATVVLNIDI